MLDEKEDFTSFEGVVRKLARVFKELEGIGGLLSREEKEEGGQGGKKEGVGRAGEGGHETGQAGKESMMKKAPHVGGKVYAICEMILEDLNNYCECMTPIGTCISWLRTSSPPAVRIFATQLTAPDSANTLNMKLFPTHSAQPRLRPHQVPLATTRLLTLSTSFTTTSSTGTNSTPFDLTTTRLLPHINGINSLSDIAHLANADISLVRRSIAHLLYYGGLLMLDIFTAGAVYAQTPDIGVIFAVAAMQAECARYVATGIGPGQGKVLANDDVLRLFASTRHGLTVRAWCEENAALLDGVDVRRFMTFGVIKGLLYRVHKYAVASTAPALDDEGKTAVAGAGAAGSGEHRTGDETPTRVAPVQDVAMARYMDGMHSFDEICTALEISEKTVMARMREAGEVMYIYR